MLTTTQEHQEHYTTAFTRVEKSLGGNGAAAPDWLEALRRRGIDRFREVGFPSTKLEEWRHTPVAPIARIPFKQAAPNDGVSVIERRLEFDNATLPAVLGSIAQYVDEHLLEPRQVALYIERLRIVRDA